MVIVVTLCVGLRDENDELMISALYLDCNANYMLERTHKKNVGGINTPQQSLSLFFFFLN